MKGTGRQQSATRRALSVSLALIPWAANAQQHGQQNIFRSTFLANEGQWPQEILYKGRSANANASFLRDGVSFSLVKPEDEHEHEEGRAEKDHHAEPDFVVWNMRFEGAEFGMQVHGEGGKPSVTSYLSGSDRSRWVVHPKEYQRVDYIGVYPGIDAQFSMAGLDLKYDHIVHPGGDPSAIRIRYDGIQALSIDTDGGLVVGTLYGEQKQHSPVSWQVIDGVKRTVDVDFVLIDANTFGFRVRGAYDRAHDLVIDPLFEMVWASYTACLGGSNNMNYGLANAMDTEGNVYMTGFVDGTFPVTPGAYSGPGNVYGEVFVAKFSSDGSTLLYSTYLPGQSSEFGTSITVDALGRAYVTGVVDLNITGLTDFPSTPNAYQPVHDTGADAFLTVLDPTGSSLVYSTFIGGSGSETGFCLALGPTGIAYVTGTTSIGDLQEVAATNYPGGDREVFVAKFDIAQSGAASLIYLVRIGAGDFGFCNSHGIAVDDAGNAYVSGSVFMSFGPSLFPVTPGAFDTSFGTGDEGTIGFLLKLGNSLPVSIAYASYLGPCEATSVATLDGEAYVTGTTFSTTFPTTPGALQPTYGGSNTDAFALKMNTSGSDLAYSTYLGGDGQDQGTDIVVNANGEAYVAGISRGSFPTSAGGFQPVHAGSFSNDIFLVQLNSSGTGYGCGGSTYVGGSEDEYYGSFYEYFAPSMSLLNVDGQDYVSVTATSHSQDFPTTPGAYEEEKVNGIADQPVFFKMTCMGIAQAPVADFDATNDPECGTYLVDFEDASAFAATSWAWSFASGTPSTSIIQDPQDIAFPGPGSYAVTLIACNDIGCDTITQPVSIDPAEPIVVDLGNDTTFCAGGSATLDAGDGLGNYSWWLNSTLLAENSASIIVTQSGMYSVLVEDDAGCSGSDSVAVEVVDVPAVMASYSVQSAPCGGSSILFEVTGDAEHVQWDLGDSTMAICTPVSYAYDSAGIYEVTLTASNGICDTVTAMSVVVPPGGVGLLANGPVPNVFTPNGDGENDLFLPLGTSASAGCASLVIMNRWGQEIRTTIDAAEGWNGKSTEGEPVPDGMYYYLLVLGDREQAGHVQLLR